MIDFLEAYKQLIYCSIVFPHFSTSITALKLKAEPVSILIMQVYMPTSEYEDEEDGKGDTNNIILGDWNSVVGDEPYRNIVGSHGLGRRNHRGQMLIDFCERNGLIVTNTWFKKPKRRLHVEGTWRLESTSVGLHPCEALIQKRCEGYADTAWGRY